MFDHEGARQPRAAEPLWRDVDRYFTELLVAHDEALDQAVAAAAEAGLPQHEVSPLQGALLHVLARAVKARRVLEIGTLGGLSAIHLARALPADGRLVTIERDPRFASVARASIERAGLSDRVEVLDGDAREVLTSLDGPFDLVFIDADKRSNPDYLDQALRLSRPGTLIVADNVVRGGAVADENTDDPDARGVRRFTERLSRAPVAATAIQTVGQKGHDGFVVALVLARTT